VGTGRDNLVSRLGTSDRPLRVAIVGAGPAGFYVLQHLFQEQDLRVQADMFDRLPTPFGLVRQGVAPDHQKIKSVVRVYEKLAQDPRYRFFGNIEFGKELSLEDLHERYDQIVFTTGAQTDRKLGIPGEDLEGSYPAAAFVAWYNGHPDYSHLKFDLRGRRAVVIGLGNVAVDVARVLSQTNDELARTDIADYALKELAASTIEEVHLLGRRGPAEAAFTNHEATELGELTETEARACLDSEEVESLMRELDPASDRLARAKLEILLDLAKRREPGKKNRLLIRFLVSPVELQGDDQGHVRKIRLVHNELYHDDEGAVRARPTEKETILRADAVFRSVGYKGAPLPGLPFRDDWGIIPNTQGRVMDPASGETMTGVYVSGWIKRGPTGVIGTNKADARETVECMAVDRMAGRVLKDTDRAGEPIEHLLESRGARYVTYADWLDLDRIELIRGQVAGRPRVKFTSREEFLQVLDALEPPVD